MCSTLCRESCVGRPVHLCFANNHTQHPITLTQSRKHPITNSIHRTTMDAEATIIDFRRASSHERTARSREKQKEVKRAAERISERVATMTIIDLRRDRARKCKARSRVKQKEAKRAAERISDHEAKASDGIGSTRQLVSKIRLKLI